MADIQAMFRITAGVVGQPAVQKLSDTVSGLNTHVDKLPGLAKTAGLAMAGLGAGLSIGVLKDKFDGVVESILRVKDAAEKTGSSIDKIGGIVQAAKITGDDFGQIEAGIIKMEKALAGADDTAKGTARALDAIGLKVSDLRKMDPADAFTQVANALDQFEDGAGKTAIAMDIFGKSGAQLLPFLKDYAEIGEQVSKVTQKQADDAEAYQRATLRLNAAKQETYRTIATSVLPTALQFVEALRDMTNEGNGAKDAVKGLASDNTLRDWAQTAALAVAVLFESLQAVGKGIYAVVGSFKAVWADIMVASTFVKNGGVVGLAWEGNRKELQDVLADRNKVLEDANKRWDDLWNYDGAKLSNDLRARFDAINSAGAAGGAAADAVATPKKSLTGYTSRAPTDGKGGGGPKADPFGNALDALGQEAAKLQEQIATIKQYGDALESAKGAQARYQVESGKFKDASEKQKIALVFQADAVDRLAEEYKNLKTAAEITKQTEAIDANTAAMGLNSREREMAAFAQDLENKGIKQGTELWNQLTEARRAALGRKDAANDDPALGLKRGLNDVADQAKGTGEVIRDALVSSFDKAGDALGEFLTTGKLDFKEFARSIIADLAKMIAKQALFNAVKAGMSAMGYADGGAFDSSGVQAFARGGVVNTPTPFKFASGGKIQNGLMGEAGPEAIMPLKRGTDGKLGVTVNGAAGGGVQIGSIVVNGDGSGGDSSETKGRNAAALARDLGSTIDQRILFHRRPGGLLAA